MNEQNRERQAGEAVAFEAAMKQTWQMIDPLRPPVAGSYALGEHNGIAAALKTVRENFERALVSIPAPQGSQAEPGWCSIMVNTASFDNLIAAMDRAERKGYLPDAVVDEWLQFDYRTDPPSPEASKAEQAEAPRSGTARNTMGEGPQPMGTAPKDGTLLRLLVDFGEANAAFEDTTQPSWTMGFNNRDNTGEDVWQLAGWDWVHDCITEARGTPLVWLPMVATQPTASNAGEQAEAPRAPGMAVMGLAGEIVSALLADENDGGYDLEAGLFGPAFSALVRRWANAEWGATQPTASNTGDSNERTTEGMGSVLGQRGERLRDGDGDGDGDGGDVGGGSGAVSLVAARLNEPTASNAHDPRCVSQIHQIASAPCDCAPTASNAGERPDLSQWEKPRFGYFDQAGRFVEFSGEDNELPNASSPRWVGGEHDMQLLRAALATKPPQCAGDPGECVFNGACMYACGATKPPQGEQKPVWHPTTEEAADGNRGIRWIHEGKICGRPTEHDVREYLVARGVLGHCGCSACKQFYAFAQPEQVAQDKKGGV